MGEIRWIIASLVALDILIGTGQAFAQRNEMPPIAELPVLEMVSAVHILTDLTLPLGAVVYDYLVA